MLRQHRTETGPLSSTPNRKLKGVACQAHRGLANTSECPGSQAHTNHASPRQPTPIAASVLPGLANGRLDRGLCHAASERRVPGFPAPKSAGEGEMTAATVASPRAFRLELNAVGCKVFANLNEAGHRCAGRVAGLHGGMMGRSAALQRCSVKNEGGCEPGSACRTRASPPQGREAGTLIREHNAIPALGFALRPWHLTVEWRKESLGFTSCRVSTVH